MKSEKKTTRKIAKAAGDSPAETLAASTPATSLKRRVTTPKTSLAIPPILLEGDAPAAPPVSGPGQRYALGPTPPVETFPTTGETGELPEAYGTQKLWLTARDPHWVYSHWDLTSEQLRKYNALSVDRHLVLRVYVDAVKGEPHMQVHVHPESRNWFVNVGHGGTQYVAELGYYARAGKWVRIASSGATLTPPDALSDDTSIRFATIPIDLPFAQLLALIKTAVAENVPLAEAIQQLAASGFKNLPGPGALAGARWTPEQEKALAQVVSMDRMRRVWIGSLEITELVRRQLLQEISSLAAAQFGSWSGAVSSFSSPFGGMERQKSFWFNVNAELILYGATEPDATVTIGGRPIKLRADGTFSYRFALPDGRYDLPAVATSADGEDSRSADLHFSRATEYRGEVGAHPQDSRLKPPRVEHVV